MQAQTVSDAFALATAARASGMGSARSERNRIVLDKDNRKPYTSLQYT